MDKDTLEKEASSLKELFKKVVNKAEFCREHKIPGGSSMASQNMSGNRPISFESALAYAEAFRVPLADISEQHADTAMRATRSLAGEGHQVIRSVATVITPNTQED